MFFNSLSGSMGFRLADLPSRSNFPDYFLYFLRNFTKFSSFFNSFSSSMGLSLVDLPMRPNYLDYFLYFLRNLTNFFGFLILLLVNSIIWVPCIDPTFTQQTLPFSTTFYNFSRNFTIFNVFLRNSTIFLLILNSFSSCTGLVEILLNLSYGRRSIYQFNSIVLNAMGPENCIWSTSGLPKQLIEMLSLIFAAYNYHYYWYRS